MAVTITKLEGQIKASEDYVTDSNLSLQKNIDDLRAQWTAKEEEMKRLQDEMDAITKEIKIIATNKQEITDAGSQKVAEWREKIQALQIAKAKEEEENSAESLAMQLRIQKAMKDAIARSRKEAGIHDDPCEEAAPQQALQGSGTFQEQHWYQWQGSYTWPQFDGGMQPALVPQSDGRSAAGYAWEAQIREPQCDQWSCPNWAWQNPQYVNWQNNPAPNFQAPSPSLSPPAPPPAPAQSPKVQAPVGQKQEGTVDVVMPLPCAGKKIPTAKKTEHSESRATAESVAPLPMPVPSGKDSRSSWREQVAKLIAERQIKARRNSSKPKDAPAPAPSSTSNEEKRCQIQSSSTIKKEELHQIGQTLDTLYARRRELEEPQSPEASKIMLGRIKKSVTWADMNSGENSEGLTSPQRAHGGG
jgi:hypothetical protein